jgi:hypothetical protein
MSLDIEQKLKVFLASAPQNIYSIPTVEISHSAMTKVYYLWREPYIGSITTDTGIKEVTPVNLEIKLAGSENNLDQKFGILLDLTDINDEFREQLDKIPLTTQEKIRVVYREYLSDDLTDIVASSVLQAESVTFSIGSANISAVQPRLSYTRTGEIYSTRDVPTLRGFL